MLPYPLDSGPKVRAYHVMCKLAERADVHLVSFVREDDPPDAVAHLRVLCASVSTHPMRRSVGADAGHLVRSMLGGKSFIVARDEVDGMHALIERVASEVCLDAVHADQLWMAQYARPVDAAFKVLDQHNAVFRIFERLAANDRSPVRSWMLRREARRLARYEAEAFDDFDHVLFVTEEDRDDLLKALRAIGREPRDVSTTVMPISIDVAGQPMLVIHEDARRVTVLGTMYWPPNIEGVLWLAENVWPRVLESSPDAVLTVIGKRPPAEVEALSRRFGSSVEVVGYVADPRPWLEQTAVFAVPLLSGGGMRVKIVDAWAWGLPVVTTSVGAEGLRFAPGRDAVCADAPDRFADAVVALLGDRAARQALRSNGRRVVEERYDVDRNYRALFDVYAPLWPASRDRGAGS